MNRRGFLGRLAGLAVAAPVVGQVVPAAPEQFHWQGYPFDGVTIPYFGRVLAWKGPRLFWSEKGRFNFFNLAVDGNWLQPNGQQIIFVEVESTAKAARIYTADRKIFRLVGDLDDPRVMCGLVGVHRIG